MHRNVPSELHTYIVTNAGQTLKVLGFMSIVCVKAKHFGISTTKTFLYPDFV